MSFVIFRSWASLFSLLARRYMLRHLADRHASGIPASVRLIHHDRCDGGSKGTGGQPVATPVIRQANKLGQ